MIKILVVDDDEFIRILLRDIFWIHAKGECEFNAVESIEKAEEFLKTNKPDLIFLDLMFQEDGLGPKTSLQFLEKIKSDPKTKDIKVIVFSGYTEKDLREKALKLGAERFLVKGEYLPKELVKVAEEVLGK